MIRGVIFDFGNVICSFDVEIFLGKLHEWSGIDVETFRERIYGSGLHSRYERGDISSEEVLPRDFPSDRRRLSAEDSRNGFTDIFTPLESTHGLIRALKGKYRLGLLSNTNEWHFCGTSERCPSSPSSTPSPSRSRSAP